MSRTKRKGIGGGLSNPKSITQFKKGKQVIIVKCDKDGNPIKPERNSCSDRNHILKRYLSKKRRNGYRKQANEEINSEL